MKISSFDKRFREALEFRHMTQTELHEKTGIGKGSISTYLRGTWKPKQDKVDLIAKALQVDPAWLMGYDVPMVPDQPQSAADSSSIQAMLDSIKSSDALIQLNRDAIGLPEEDIKQASAFLAFLKAKKKEGKG